MICPCCTHDMIVVEHNNIEVDYCSACRGVWFDSGELELLLEDDGLAGPASPYFLRSTEVKSPEKTRKCPICRRKMGEIAIGKEPVVFIDCCRQGDGLWFDGGELGQLVEQLVKPVGQPNHHQQLLTFLREAFQAKE